MNVDQTLFAAAEIASAYLKRNTLKPGDVAPLVHLIHTSLSQIEAPPPPVKQEPAVPVKIRLPPTISSAWRTAAACRCSNAIFGRAIT